MEHEIISNPRSSPNSQSQSKRSENREFEVDHQVPEKGKILNKA